MNRYKLILLFFCLNSIIGVSAIPYQKTADGILISLNQKSSDKTKTIRLQVITDYIIRVTASPSATLPETKSLITTFTDTKKTGWSATQEGDFVVLKTATTKAFVSIKTGEIKFA